MKLKSILVFGWLGLSINVNAQSHIFDLEIHAVRNPQQTCDQVADEYSKKLSAAYNVPIFDKRAYQGGAPNENYCSMVIRYAAPMALKTTLIKLDKLTNCTDTLQWLSATHEQKAGLKMFSGACFQYPNQSFGIHYLAFGESNIRLVSQDLYYSLSQPDRDSLAAMLKPFGIDDVKFSGHYAFYFSKDANPVFTWEIHPLVGSSSGAIRFQDKIDCQAQIGDMTKFLLQTGRKISLGYCAFSDGQYNALFIRDLVSLIPNAKFAYIDVPKTYPSFSECMKDKSRVVSFYKDHMAFTANYAFCTHSARSPYYVNLRLIDQQ